MPPLVSGVTDLYSNHVILLLAAGNCLTYFLGFCGTNFCRDIDKDFLTLLCTILIHIKIVINPSSEGGDEFKKDSDNREASESI